MKNVKETDEEYHSRSKSGEYLSSHMLATFRECPRQYYEKINSKEESEDCTAYRIGRAVHKMVLEGVDEFDKTYAIGGPINDKTGKPYGMDTARASVWFSSTGKEERLSKEEAIDVDNLYSHVIYHPEARKLINGGVAEKIFRVDSLLGVDIKCQAKIDYMSTAIVDLKTCDNLKYFEFDFKRYGYAYQMAFYRDIVVEFTKDPLWPVFVVAVEKNTPYRVGVWELTQDFLLPFSKANKDHMIHLKSCRESGKWPTGYEEIRRMQ